MKLLKRVLGLGVTVLLFFLFSSSAKAIGNPVKINNSSNAAVGPEIVADSNGYLHTVYMEVADENVPWGNHANAGI